MPGKRPADAKKSTPPARTTNRAPGATSAGATGGADRLTQLERLIELMVQKDVVEVELEEGETRWRVRRTDPQAAMPQAVTFAAPPTMAMPAMAMPQGGHAPAAAGGAPAAAPEPQGEVFKSPMLGTFYRAASPDAEPFVKVGDRVGADRTLCIIEAMKVMNEIKAEREFEVLEILVKNGEPVEFGQPLFLIR
jgi:acetyl-CoA carboxylase biotin carboxyl carrier protein